jgi:hypothetical protein
MSACAKPAPESGATLLSVGPEEKGRTNYEPARGARRQFPDRADKGSENGAQESAEQKVAV